MQFSHQNRRVGVFIDVQNMYYSARNMYGSKVNFGNIVKHGIGTQHLVRAIAYTISTKTGDELPFFEALHKMGIEVNMKELLEYEGGQKKGDWDVGITVDIIRMLDMVDVVVLVSGDGDYVPLGEYIKNRGRVFHVISFRESTSSKLVDCADVYTNLSDDLGQFLIRDPHYRPQTHRTSSVTDTFSDVIAEQAENKMLVFTEKAPIIAAQRAPLMAPRNTATVPTRQISVPIAQNAQKPQAATGALKKRRGRPKKAAIAPKQA
jgi:uncharacterized LabA/DUF88 family protein